MPKNQLNRTPEDYPKINTFTTSSAKRMSDESLSFPEQYPYEIASYFESDISMGLPQKRVKKQRTLYGSNIISEPVSLSFSESIKKQSKNLLMVFLIFASIIFYFLTSETTYLFISGAAVVIILINAFMERKAGQALNRMQKMSAPRVTVIRSGKTVVTDSRGIVAGDIIVLEAGNIVPADARLIECTAFTVLETPVSGIKTAVKKDARFVAKSKTDLVYENMVYAGSIVYSGKATAIVCDVGKNVMVNRLRRRHNKSSLPKILQSVYTAGSIFSLLVVGLQLILMLLGIFKGIALTEIFILALAIGAVSLCDTAFSLSSLGMSSAVIKSLEEGAVIKNLDSIEPLCRIDSIMCDKNTAFPSKNIKAQSIYADLSSYEINKQNKDKIYDTIRFLLLCSSYREKLKTKNIKKKLSVKEKYEGNIYTLALLEALNGMGLDEEELNSNFYRIETEFDSHGEACRLLGLLDGKSIVIIKGTPENVISRCVGYRKNGVNYKFNEKYKNKLLDDAFEISQKQVPVAVAMGYTTADSLRDITVERKLVFIGFAGFYSSTEIDTASAVFKCSQAGIETVISTEDSYYTAYNLAKNAGIITDKDQICTREQLLTMEEGLFIANSEQYKVFLGLNHDEWLYILQLRKQNGHNIAVSASDTEQLKLMKESDVSFVPVSGSSDTMKHSCDVQMFDDGFDTIVSAVKYSKLILKRITGMAEYITAGFITMFIWTLLSVIFKGALPFRVQDVFIYGLVINFITALSLALTPLNREMLRESSFINLKTFFLKKLSGPAVYSLGSAVLCMLSGYLASDTGETGSIMASMLTYFGCMALYSYMCGAGKTPLKNRSYKNYYLILSIIAGAGLYSATSYIPKLAEIFGYMKLPVTNMLSSLGIAVIYFLAIQAGLFIYGIIKNNKGAETWKK